jgi:hypothetical protein
VKNPVYQVKHNGALKSKLKKDRKISINLGSGAQKKRAAI